MRPIAIILALLLAGCPHARPLIDYEGEVPPPSPSTPAPTQGPPAPSLLPFPLRLVPTARFAVYPDLGRQVEVSASHWNVALGLEAFTLTGPGRPVTLDILDYDPATRVLGRVDSLTDPHAMWVWPGLLPPNDRGVVLHELGHLLGLTHSNSGDDMMFPTNSFANDLTPNDIARGREAVRLRQASPATIGAF